MDAETASISLGTLSEKCSAVSRNTSLGLSQAFIELPGLWKMLLAMTVPRVPKLGSCGPFER